MKVEHDDEVVEGAFHRLVVAPETPAKVLSQAKPVAVWLPSNSRVTISSEQQIVVDFAESVDHEDVVSLDRKLREKDKIIKVTKRALRRARRRLRGLERPDRPTG